jgi:pimeloyl-ACP methyl ester carboxylesterase
MPDATELIAAVTGGRLPRHAQVRSGALALHCLLWGDDGAPTVLLVHGNGGHAHWWDPLVPHFVPGYRLIAPDLRGHGESDWPTQPAYGIGEFSADLAAVVERLIPRRCAIIAHSMGARVALWFAAHHPARVRGLALLDTSIAGVDAESARRWRGRVIGRRDGRTYGSYAEAVAAFRFVPPEAGVASAISADLAHHAVVERVPGKWTFRFDRAVLALEGDGAGDLTALAADLTCPLWVGRGSDSYVIRRREVDPIRARGGAVEVHDFPGAHHFFLSSPQPAGTALRRFLDRLPE